MKNKNILNDITHSKGYEIALFTSFNLDIDFFENHILNTLINNHLKIISLFIDENNLIDALNRINNCHIEQKYRITPIKLQKAFHPKLVLLLSPQKAKLIISSANLTYSGYMQNNEVYNTFEYTEQDEKYLNVIQDAITYFVRLAQDFKSLDLDIIAQITEYSYYKKLAPNQEILFLSNYTDPIITQIHQLVTDAKQIDIAVPFYDTNLKALDRIKSLYPNAKINLYIQNELSTFNFSFNQQNHIIARENLFIFQDFKEIGTKNRYHGKVFRFQSDTNSYILYGSANCTNAALFESGKNGNLECDVLVKGTIEEFNDFFQNFEEIEENTAVSNQYLHIPDSKKNSFEYQFSSNEKELIFRCQQQPKNLKIFINEEQVPYFYRDNQIIIPTDNYHLTGLFKVKFQMDTGEEILNCYQVNQQALNSFRNRKAEDLNISLENLIDNPNDSFQKYYSMLLKLIPYDSQSLKDYIQNKQLYEEAKQEKELDDNYDDNFIVDFDIPIEILNKQKQYHYIETLKSNVIANFTERIKKGLIKNKKRKEKPDGENEKSSDEKKQYRPRSGETVFSSHIKRLFKNILNKQYLENDKQNDELIKQYIDNILLLLNVIFTYNDDHESELFDIETYVDYILKFVESLTDFSLSNLDENITYTIKVMLFIPIIYHCLNKQELEEKEALFPKKELENRHNFLTKEEANIRRILLSYDRSYSLKNTYSEYLQKAYDMIPQKLDYDIVNKYISGILDYLDETQLEDFIKSKINDNAVIKIEKNLFIIHFTTYEIKKYMNTSNLEYLIKRIRSTYNQLGTINKLFLHIENGENNFTLPNPLEFINYFYDFSTRNIEKWYKNRLDEQPKLISKERL